MKLNFTFKRFSLFLVFLMGSAFVWGQTVYTFTSCGITGKTGPTQTNANSSYIGTNLAGNVTVIGGIQYWTVPVTASYRIEGYGGQGHGIYGGRGAHISGEFTLNAGDQIKIIVGQKASPPVGSVNQYGGGGGSFVTTVSNVPYIVAGGGGGNHSTSYVTTADASIANNGFAGFATNSGTAGTAGSGGGTASSADGGGGLLGNGGGTGGGSSFVNGGIGGAGTTSGHGEGGFGCGGGTSSWDNYRSGGGGGYSGGGGGGENGQVNAPSGGGGGSYNSGTNPINIAGVQTGDGLVVITLLQSFPNDAGISTFPGAPNCNGSYPFQATVQNYGNNMLNSVTINWSINGVPQTPYSLTTPLDTINGAGINNTTITLGTLVVNGNTTVKAWTTAPNSVSDPANGNDTLQLVLDPFTVTANYVNQINCYGGMNGVAQATSVNSAATPTFSWSSGSNSPYMIGVGAGTYILTGNDGTCLDTASIVFTQPTELIVTSSVMNVSCNGANDGQTSVAVSGGTPGYIVDWTGGTTGTTNSGLAGGNYIYTVHDANSCTVSDTIVVIEPAAIVLNSTVTAETMGTDGSIDLMVTGGTPNYTYSWSNGSTSQDPSGLSSGTYTVTVTDLNGCTETLSVTVNSVVGIQENSTDFGVKVFPNPTNGKFNVVMANADKNASIEVFDVLGNRVELLKNAGSKTTIQLNERNGVYFVRVTNNNQTIVERIVLRN
ncbi:MAG: T9SS type A sorting domain-containing protein [Crocinitomicaceae bacterium]